MSRKIKTTRRAFAEDAGWQIAQQIYSMLLSLIIGALTARYLGPSNYGIIGYGASLVAIFTSISNLGMESIVINDLIKNRGENGKLIGTAITMRLASSLFSMLLVGLLVLLIEPENRLLQLITTIQSVALFFNATEVLGYWFKSLLKTKYIAIAGMVASTAIGIWRIILLVRGTDVVYFAASSCVQALATGIVLIVAFYRNKDFQLSFDWNKAIGVLKRSYHFILSGLTIVLYTQVDKIMIGAFIGEEQVGYYTAAASIAMIWEFVPAAFINSSRTLIFESKIRDQQEYLIRLRKLLQGVLIMGLAVSVFFTIFGGLIIKVLYGEAFSKAEIPLQILIWSTIFAMLGSARGTWIIAEDLIKYPKYYTLIGSMTNLILNYLLIPAYGIIGAAVATLVSQIIVAVVAPLFFRKSRVFITLLKDAIVTTPQSTCEMLVLIKQIIARRREQ